MMDIWKSHFEKLICGEMADDQLDLADEDERWEEEPTNDMKEIVNVTKKLKRGKAADTINRNAEKFWVRLKWTDNTY